MRNILAEVDWRCDHMACVGEDEDPAGHFYNLVEAINATKIRLDPIAFKDPDRPICHYEICGRSYPYGPGRYAGHSINDFTPSP